MFARELEETTTVCEFLMNILVPIPKGQLLLYHEHCRSGRSARKTPIWKATSLPLSRLSGVRTRVVSKMMVLADVPRRQKIGTSVQKRVFSWTTTSGMRVQKNRTMVQKTGPRIVRQNRPFIKPSFCFLSSVGHLGHAECVSLVHDWLIGAAWSFVHVICSVKMPGCFARMS